MSSAVRDLNHLVKRFFSSLFAKRLSQDEQSWVGQQLLPGELELWCRMSVSDQRHALGVARRVQAVLSDEATRPVLAAALLHDVGKIESGLGTFGRSVATVLANLGAKSEKVARYRSHNEIGQRLLEAAGSDPLTSIWAYEHERSVNEWTINPRVAAALHNADDD